MKLFRVTKPGFFTTVQDLGRQGFLRFGVPVSGAMDDFSLQLANMLVKNGSDDACLEITMLGPELEVLDDTQIAVMGDISLRINEQDSEVRRTITVKSGDAISFGKVQNGCRAYLAVRGGINVPLILGSRSTYVRGEIGGIAGRQLRTGDYIEGFDAVHPIECCLSLPMDRIPNFSAEINVDVILGPQLESFATDGISAFLSSPYAITVEADRMGYRLEGALIEHSERVDTISDAILPGSVQVPTSGKPIVTMLDAQTTGGYPKIAAVVSTDLHVLGQGKPGDKVCFHETTLSEAHRRLLEYKKLFRLIEANLHRRFLTA